MLFIYRYSTSQPMPTTTLGIPHCYDIKVAESLAFSWSTQTAIDLAFWQVNLEAACLELFNAWKKKK